MRFCYIFCENVIVLKDVIIVGGGLAGLISGILLAKAGISTTLLEKKSYPFHRVCGEYISNEVVPFLHRENLFPSDFNPSLINEFELSSVTGTRTVNSLIMGGFGISRFSFDHYLFNEAKKCGVTILQDCEVEEIRFQGEKFFVVTKNETFQSSVVVGSFGKRSKLDVSLKRTFIKRRSPYTGVKYHIRTEHPPNRISLHNFPGGYCGVSNVEDGITNLCYLTERKKIRQAGSIQKLEREILSQNPFLKKIFKQSEFLFDKPEVINEISFESKAPMEDHIIMVGDSAGMIAPLCGNGMAMAIHSAKISSEVISNFCKGKISRLEMEMTYEDLWRKNFQSRLWRGRNIQKLFGNPILSAIAVNLLMSSKRLSGAIIKSTHGEYF
jgi:flavin-dependent dehydrogenase